MINVINKYVGRELGPQVSDILELVTSFVKFRFIYIPRKVNGAANLIAKMKLLCDGDEFWIEDFLEWMSKSFS